ncbi:MAG: hypothetical protein U0R71_12585 [Solirubrobacterales bacterium]
MSRRVLAIVTDRLEGSEPLGELSGDGAGDDIDLRIVVPAVEATAFRHTMGDIDEPREQAESRLAATLAALRREGVEAAGEVGDPDPVQAATDALLQAPADEVVIFEHEEGQARWFEEGLFERAKAGLDPPLRMVVLHQDESGERHVADVERAGPGTEDPDAEEVTSAYVPGLTRADYAGIVAGIVGTVAVAVLAAAVTSTASGEEGGTYGVVAIAILIAIATALANLAHVVGLTLMESVRYRGGFAKFFRYLALVGTPIAVLVNLILLITAS